MKLEVIKNELESVTLTRLKLECTLNGMKYTTMSPIIDLNNVGSLIAGLHSFADHLMSLYQKTENKIK